jgi:uncharacterized membrane protein YphA (DoxX/SURF4 family)
MSAELPTATELEGLEKTRFDYATKWFEYHAAQRVSMFNYFLIAVGILTNAYALLLREGFIAPSVLVALIGMVMCAVFIGLDTRNRQLTHFAEGVLRKIERKTLFTDYKDDRGVKLGMLSLSTGFLFD